MLKLRGHRIHGIAEIAHLRSLKELDLSGCITDEISLCFINLNNMRRLGLYRCHDLKELPESVVKLRCLEKLSLSNCWFKSEFEVGEI